MFGDALLLANCGEDSVSPTPTVPPRGSVGDPVRAWRDDNARLFDGPHLPLPHDDLEFMRDLVGAARIVSPGENTHGARDFFEMKARLLRFLVEIGARPAQLESGVIRQVLARRHAAVSLYPHALQP